MVLRICWSVYICLRYLQLSMVGALYSWRVRWWKITFSAINVTRREIEISNKEKWIKRTYWVLRPELAPPPCLSSPYPQIGNPEILVSWNELWTITVLSRIKKVNPALYQNAVSGIHYCMKYHYKKFYIEIWIWLLLSEKYWNLKIWTIQLVEVDKSVILFDHPKRWKHISKNIIMWK